MRRFFYSFFSFLLALFFILLGLTYLLSPWVSKIYSLLVNNTISLLVLGAVFLLLGIFFIAHIIHSSRKKYYYVRSGKKAISIDKTLIQECFSTYLKAQFPEQEIPFQLDLKDNKIHITADLPFVPLDQHKITLERMENDLSHIFTSTLGYRNEFFLNVSFSAHQNHQKG